MVVSLMAGIIVSILLAPPAHVFPSLQALPWCHAGQCMDFQPVLPGLELLAGSLAEVGALCVLGCGGHYCGCLSTPQSVYPPTPFSTV